MRHRHLKTVFSHLKQALKSGRLFCFSVPFSLAGEKARFIAENSAIRGLIALLRANEIVRDHQ